MCFIKFVLQNHTLLCFLIIETIRIFLCHFKSSAREWLSVCGCCRPMRILFIRTNQRTPRRELSRSRRAAREGKRLTGCAKCTLACTVSFSRHSLLFHVKPVAKLCLFRFRVFHIRLFEIVAEIVIVIVIRKGCQNGALA